MLFFLLPAQPKSHTSFSTALLLVHTYTRTDMHSNNTRHTYTCVLTHTQNGPVERTAWTADCSLCAARRAAGRQERR